MRDIKEKKGFWAFIENNVFSILLVLTLVLLFTFAVASMFYEEPKQENPIIDNKQNDTVEKNDTDTTEKKTDEIVDNTDEQTEPVIKEEPVDLSYSVPVDGNIRVQFSGTSPVFSDTLQEWHLHQGVDYVTEESEPVYAVFGGTVEDIYKDEMMGNTVVVAQTDSIRTIYQSLSDIIRVTIGQNVEKGTLIGTTGDSAETECAEGIHLHIAMLKDGTYIDPETLIK